MKKVDFHMHSTHSDGTFPPVELMRACKTKNLDCVSVTEHDTVSSFDECSREAAKLGIELVSGIEMSAQFEPGTLHILGYFIHQEDPGLKSCLEKIQTARRERNPAIIQRLNALGIEITLDEVIQEAAAGSKDREPKQIGRPHFARVLMKKGYVTSIAEAFDKYLGKGRPAYADKRRVSGAEAIRAIRESGGIASVAHPKQMKLDSETLDREIKKLAEQGLEAIEVYNSCQGPKENTLYRNIAKQYNLVVTGGSDFHGAVKPGVELGNLGKDARLGYEMVEALRERIQKRSR